jgi:hypothetical protein
MTVRFQIGRFLQVYASWAIVEIVISDPDFEGGALPSILRRVRAFRALWSAPPPRMCPPFRNSSSKAKHSFASVGVTDDQLPGFVGQAAENLDRLVANCDRLSRVVVHRALEVGVQ